MPGITKDPRGAGSVAPIGSDEFDRYLASREFIGNPYAALRQIQVEAPVYWSNSIGAWLITRYDDIMPTFRNTTEYSNEGRLLRAAAHLPATDRQRLSVFEEYYATKGLIHSDPPYHTRLRRFTAKAFTPSAIQGLKPYIAGVTESLLNKCDRDGGMEVITDLAGALPVAVLCKSWGYPRATSHCYTGGQIRSWASRVSTSRLWNFSWPPRAPSSRSASTSRIV